MKVHRLGMALLVVAACACRRQEAEQRESAPTGRPEASLRLAWEPGQRATYELGVVTVSRTGETPVPLFMGLHAQLALAWEARGDELLARVALSDVRLVDQVGRPLEGAEELVRDLSRPWGLEFQGARLTAYFDPAGALQSTAGYRHSLAAALQLPLRGAPAQLSSTEWDATGLAGVTYTKRPDGSWDWTKRDYERVLMTRQSASPGVSTKDLEPVVERASGRIQLDDRGLVELSRHEELSLRLNATQTLSADTDLTLKRLSAAAGQAAVDLDVLEPARRRSVDVAVGQRSSASYDEVMIGGRKYDEVVAALGAVTGAPGGQERANLFQALVALFRTQPRRVAEAEHSIRAAAPVAETLLDALAMASTPESLRVLAALSVDTGWTPARRKRAASSLIRAPRPDAAALDAVVQLGRVTALHEHALLGTGTYVRIFREQGQVALAQRGSDFLRAAFAAAQAAHEKKTVLLAIANSGDAGFYDLALAAQDDSDGDVRQAAIQAMRLMDGAQIEPRMVGLLARKDASDVAAALHALGRRAIAAPTTLKAVVALASTHQVPEVRRQAVLALVGWSDRWPDAARTVLAVHASDSDERVRSAAVLPAHG